MGYYTHYNIEFSPRKQEVEQEIEENEDLYALQEDSDSCKWYDHDTDMKSLSNKFPEVLFKLKGEGEEAGDLWHKYYKNGKMQYCPAIVAFEQYDESKLK